MKKIIVEIDGVRHKLVKDNLEDTPDDGICKDCSLYSVCRSPVDSICWSMQKEYCHFEREEEV